MELLSSPVAVGALAALFATYPLIRFARAVGWQDAPGPSDGERKLQARPVPVVGGAAVLLGILALGIGEGGSLDHIAGVTHEGASVWPPLLAAFILGLIDDLLAGGLRPGLKVAGQVCVGLVVGLSVFPGESAHLLGCLVLVPLALNVWNTFDNADGAATGVGAICLFSIGSPAAGPLLGFLPWNLRGRGGAAAYLGDSGSHLLGCLVLLHPGAWPLMALPAMDLLRVSVLRIRGGQPPWQGDRRHLAHRLEAKGLSPLAVALCLWGVTAISCGCPGWLGLGLTAVAFLGLVLASRPCPGTEVPR
jgi:UDP-GlcNAc:undecaprenyl-phosphate GlcNAc-1-phosphate transferase